GVRSNLAAASEILAGLVLKAEVVESFFRSELMRESVIYQKILEEGLQQGKMEGLQQGKMEGLQQGKMEGLQQGKEEVAVNLLQNGMTVELVAQLTQLPFERVQSLQQGFNSHPN
ncbi:hypothetical protein K4A83_20520, partial [Spirulina subsalsa FACHB-351]|nr:hypothetical protein [Spirulina subsalsa FACHB-351]